MRHARELVAATDLPVSADLENGFGDDPGTVAETIRLAAAAQQLERARGGWDSMLNEHPLALGAIGLAIGAVVAAMAPRTEKEDQLMGQARDDLLDKAKQAGTEKLEQMKEAQRPAEKESFDSTKWPPSTKAVP
jgi:2-methylisocitrate lyase-like PEP mutase family enzyme